MSRSVFRPATRCLGCFALALIIVVAGWLEKAMAQSREDDPVYREQIQAALGAYDAGQLVEAKAHFEAALLAYPNNARVLRGLGTVELEQVNYVAAARYLEQALASTELALTDTLRKETETALGEANGFVGRVQVITSPADAEVRLQGRHLEHATAVILQPGVYALEVSAPGFRTDSRQLLVAARQYQIVQLNLERTTVSTSPAPVAPPSRLEKAGPWIAIGASAGLSVAGAVLIAKGASVYRDLDADVYYADWQRDRDRYPRLLGAGGALLGLGVIGLATGVWWQVHNGRSDMRAALGPQSLWVSGRF
ncbi:MAG: PEGA domain-containing protein [Polyangiales bacterium]